ncbi:MAG TPA: hypothetical protein VGZ22_12745 [Isosphaeraceae bacterium]|nr:hypothetical protein [Isosphaeraceae bacterium]
MFATGRTIKQTELGAGIHSIVCDHADDQAVEAVFRVVEASAGRLDLLVNVAWGGYERMVENGQFTYIAPFRQQPLWRWDAMVTTGVRAAIVARQFTRKRARRTRFGESHADLERPKSYHRRPSERGVDDEETFGFD